MTAAPLLSPDVPHDTGPAPAVPARRATRLPAVRPPTLMTALAVAERVGLDHVLLAASRHWPTRTRPLADPPPGSGLRPVLGDRGMPVVGHSLELFVDFVTSTRLRGDTYGPVSWSNGPIGPTVAVGGPEACEEVLRNVDRDVANGPGWEPLIGPFFHRGVMLLDFDEHLTHRRMMQSAFTRDRLQRYLELMQPGLAAGVAAWRPRDRFLVLPHVKHLLLENAADVFIGGHPDRATERRLNRAFIDTVRAGSAFLRRDLVPYSRWWKGARGREVLERFFREQIPARRAAPPGDDFFSAFVHLVDEDGTRWSDDDVVNHMIFLLMAAHDTSTITLNTMIWAMGAHPEWQEAARAESDAIGPRLLTWDDLDRLPTLDLLQKEALRYVAPVLILMRAAVRDTQVAGHFVPAGTRLMVSPFATHRDPDVWHDPDRFDPLRFAPGGEAEHQHPYAWIPFGGGVHKCIGLHFAGVQIKALLHQLLQRHRWSVPEGYELRLDTSSLPVPRDGLPVRLARRGD